MAISKIILNGTTQMDTTQVTVDSSNLFSGFTALGKDGETLTGTAPSLIKKSITFTKTSSGRTQTITNPLSPLIPKVIIVQANMNDFPSSPTNGAVSSTGVTLVGPQSSSESYNFYNNNVSYYNSSGTLTTTYSYSGDYRNRISLDGSTIIVGVRSQTGSTFLANVEYTIDLYYW